MSAAIQERGSMLEERVAKIESDVEHLKTDVGYLKSDVSGLRTEFHSFRVDVTREFGGLRAEMAQGFGRVDARIEHTRRWMIVTALGMVTTSVGALGALARLMKWF